MKLQTYEVEIKFKVVTYHYTDLTELTQSIQKRAQDLTDGLRKTAYPPMLPSFISTTVKKVATEGE